MTGNVLISLGTEHPEEDQNTIISINKDNMDLDVQNGQNTILNAKKDADFNARRSRLSSKSIVL